MIIKYKSLRFEHEIEVDLSNEEIEQWYFGIDDSMGNKTEYLSIEWKFKHLTKFNWPSVGIHPPLINIINKEEVLDWLKNNHQKKEIKK